MANISFDSELMTNYAAAAAVPPSSHFVALVDDNHRPMILCLSDATNKSPPRLQIIQEDDVGNRFIYDLAGSLKLTSTDKIMAFDATQAADGRVFLTLAVESGVAEARLYIVKPFRVFTDVLLGNILSLQCVASPAAKIGRVYSIHLVCATTFPAGGRPV